MNIKRLYKNRAYMRAGAIKSRQGVSNRSHSSPTTDYFFESSIQQIANDFDIDVELVRRAIDNALKAGTSTKSDVLIRLQTVSDGLVRELGGRKSLQLWSRAAIPALDNARPLDLLVNGRVSVLERVEKVLKSGVFS